MDRKLSPRIRIARWCRLLLKSLLAGAFLLTLAWAGQGYLRPSLARDALRVATVERGPLEARITSAGIIVSSLERSIASPISTQVQEIHVTLGQRVARGEPIMQLDATAAALLLSDLEGELTLKQASSRSRELELADTIRQSLSRRELLGVDLESRRARLARLERLGSTGAISAHELLEAELDVKRTEIELEQTVAAIASLRTRREAELERLALELSMLERRRTDQARRVALATVKAGFDGIVTHLVQEQGAYVVEGQTLATLAADDAFAVEATVADFYAPQLRPGQRVRVRASHGELDGRLSRIVPVAGEPRLALFVTLDESAAPWLGPNLRVDVDVVTAEKPDVLQLNRGPALESAGIRTLFVIDGERALARQVRLGASDRRTVEILEGLDVGDVVIISDMRDYERMSEVRLR